jgi:hypothetical protein
MQAAAKESKLNPLPPDDETKRKYIVNSSFVIELDEKSVPRRWKNRNYEWITFTPETQKRYATGFFPKYSGTISYEEFIKGVVSGEIEI